MHLAGKSMQIFPHDLARRILEYHWSKNIVSRPFIAVKMGGISKGDGQVSQIQNRLTLQLYPTQNSSK
jgi:hypothetical protein